MAGTVRAEGADGGEQSRFVALEKRELRAVARDVVAKSKRQAVDGPCPKLLAFEARVRRWGNMGKTVPIPVPLNAETPLPSRKRRFGWALLDLNQRPLACEASALNP